MKPIPIEQWPGMRVLTVREPWASLIVGGQKDVENRCRYFGHRGPLLIHVSGTLTRDYYESAWDWVHAHVPPDRRPFGLPMYGECKANRGRIIGGCTAAGCERSHSSPWYDGSGWAIDLDDEWLASEHPLFKGQQCLGTYRGTP